MVRHSNNSKELGGFRFTFDDVFYVGFEGVGILLAFLISCRNVKAVSLIYATVSVDFNVPKNIITLFALPSSSLSLSVANFMAFDYT
jgi:hypothetical protein